MKEKFHIFNNEAAFLKELEEEDEELKPFQAYNEGTNSLTHPHTYLHTL